MDNFQIETAQNVSISQNIAGIGERILAFLTDALILLGYVVIFSFIMNSLEIARAEEWTYRLALGLPIFLYFLVWEVLWNGQTPGKAALNIRVVKIDGSKPTFSNYLVRWLLRIIDITISSGSVAVITILLNGKGQRLGDLAAGTTVISEQQRIDVNKLLQVDLPEDYEPKYPQVTVLSDKDVQEIKVLYQDSLKNSNFGIIKSLSVKVSQLLGVQPTENSSDFIKTVIRDYNYFTQN